jgi:hypothetical protein
MRVEHLDYAQPSENAMIAAEAAASLDECHSHLNRRYATLSWRACTTNGLQTFTWCRYGPLRNRQRVDPGRYT